MTEQGQLELEDIEIGKEYIGGKYISPGYLANAKLTVTKKGRKNVTVKHPAYHETFSVNPYYLIPITDQEA